MSHQTTSQDTTGSISLPGSEAGNSPSTLRGGETLPSCLEAVLASPSPTQEAKRDSKTSGTSGPSGSTSSAKSDLRLSSVSRFLPLSTTVGSTLYAMTWKDRVTPAGRLYSELAVSVRRTSGKGCIGWVTPTAFDSTNGGRPRALRYKGNHPSEKALKSKRSPDKHGSYRGDLKDWAGTTASGSSAATDTPVQLNPELPRWLMGYPKSWASCVPTETR